jgi:hypothetical protein
MSVNLKNARDFVYSAGTLWERALFATLFQGEGADHLHQSLLCYKNPDGGFGHALEHDIRTPDSHPAALEFLLLMLTQSGVPTGHLLDGTTAWVERQRQPDGGLTNPASLLDYPHAPWWEGGGQNMPDSITGNLVKLGCASDSLRQTTAAWVQANLTVEKIRETEWLFMNYHAYDYFSAVKDAPNFDALWQATVENIAACAQKADPKQYYEILRFAPTPDSPVAKALPPKFLARVLDTLESAQTSDGGWQDEHGLPQWYPYTTILVLKGLRSHGRAI